MLFFRNVCIAPKKRNVVQIGLAARAQVDRNNIPVNFLPTRVNRLFDNRIFTKTIGKELARVEKYWYKSRFVTMFFNSHSHVLFVLLSVCSQKIIKHGNATVKDFACVN